MTVLDAFDLAASLALLRIVDRWNQEMGYAFSSCAMPTILGELRHYFRDATWIARPPRERLASILDQRGRDVLRMRFQPDLRAREIAAPIGCSEMQVSRIIRTSLERLSAHAAVACGGWSTSDTTEGATA
jgi:DNA-directed RNA polymerase specialized sigma subunit